MSRLTFSLIFIFITGLTISVRPQSSEVNAFSNISIKVNLITNRSTDELNRYWNGDKGFEGSIQMPFYLGILQGGIRYIPYKEKEPYYHDFSTFFYFLGFGEELNLPFNCSFYTGIKFGGYSMAFHDDSLTIYQKDETEFAAGVSSYLAVKFFNNFKLSVGADYSKIYTHKRIELFLISAGIAYTFQTPVWLKELLD